MSGQLPVQALDQFSTLLELLTPSFLYGATLAKDNIGVHHADRRTRIVQIHIIPGHYVVSCQRDNKIYIYDSLPYINRPQQLLPQLQIRYAAFDNHPMPLSLISYVVAQTQYGSSDCGLFAAANAMLLLNDMNPESVALDQSALRNHFQRCLLTRTITPFPTTEHYRTNSSLSRYFTVSFSNQQKKKSENEKSQDRSEMRKVNRERKAEYRAKRTDEKIDADRISDKNRKKQARKDRSNETVNKDRSQDKQRKHQMRDNRTQDQIDNDRTSDKLRKIQSRDIRTPEQITKYRVTDRTKRSLARANKTQEEIVVDHTTDKVRKQQSRGNRSVDQISTDKQKESQRWKNRQKDKYQSVDEQKRYENFRSAIQYGPIFPCNVCHRTFVKTSVVDINDQRISKLEEKSPGLYEKTVAHDVYMNGQQYICNTCNRWIMHNHKIPPLSVKNGLYIEDIPSELDLSELSNVLIAKNIIFLKIFKLPKSRWNALKDRIVNVPVTDDDILQTLSELKSLPRLPDQAGLVPVQLKRKVSYKSAVQETCIDPQKLIQAVAKLKELGHPGYSSIELSANYLTDFDAFMTEDADHGNSNENVQMDSLERDLDCESNSPMNPYNITEELSHSNGETDKNVEEDSEIELYSCNDNEEVNSEKETNMDSIRKYQTTKQS